MSITKGGLGSIKERQLGKLCLVGGDDLEGSLMTLSKERNKTWQSFHAKAF